MTLIINSFATEAEALTAANSTADGVDSLNFYAENDQHGIIFGSNPVGFAGVTVSRAAMVDHLVDGASAGADKIDITSGSDVVATITKAHLQAILDSVYEPKIETKGTAFNKDFGSTSGTVAEGSELANKEDAIGAKGTAFNKDFGSTDGTVAEGSALANKEDAIGAKGTAFNKDFGTTAGTVAEGSALAGKEDAIANKGTAFNKNFGIGSDDVVRGNQVLTDVPADAAFTDTLYEKPASEDISYINDLQDALDVRPTATDLFEQKPDHPDGELQVKETLLPDAGAVDLTPIEDRINELEQGNFVQARDKGLSTYDYDLRERNLVTNNALNTLNYWTTTDYPNKSFILDSFSGSWLDFKVSKQKDHFFLKLTNAAPKSSLEARVVVVSWNAGGNGGDWAKNYTLTKDNWGKESPFNWGVFNDTEIEPSRPCSIHIDTDIAAYYILIHKFDDSDKLSFQVTKHNKQGL